MALWVRVAGRRTSCTEDMPVFCGMYFTPGGDRRTIGGRCRERHAHEGGLVMPSSAIIDLAIGLIFVFGVTAALASVFTELVSRFIGLRGA